VDARVDERLLHPVTVDRDRGLLGVLLDDREQVREQPPFGRGQLGPLDGRVSRRVIDPIDGPARGRDQRRSAVAAVLAPAYTLARRFALLLRNRRPSSYRFMYAL
jgi:hypothetical protein